MRRMYIAILLLLALTLVPVGATAQSPVVRAVFFFSPTCPHCEKVINQDMPPLAQEYGDQLRVLYVDVTTELGQTLYQSAIQSLSIPKDRLGVPTLVIGERVLVGSLEIPEQFPSIIDQGLAQEGIDWPAIPGLAEVLASIDEGAVEPAAASAGVLDRIGRDPVGNALSIIVLLGMLASAGWAWRRWQAPAGGGSLKPLAGQPWLALALILVGAAISGYLTFVEAGSVEAVCGPIGDCNTVNSSRFATVFGVPVGLLGLLGYFAIGITWLVGRSGQGRTAKQAQLVFGLLTAFGFLFSIYLTFLEPFVIGATCAWCLSSAIIMTVLFVMHIGPTRVAYDFLRRS